MGEADPTCLDVAAVLPSGTYFVKAGEDITFTVDASPYGIGGVLYIGGVPEAFYDQPYEEDEVILHTKRGSADGQQMWECLSILLALRIWWSYWAERKAILSPSGVTALLH